MARSCMLDFQTPWLDLYQPRQLLECKQWHRWRTFQSWLSGTSELRKSSLAMAKERRERSDKIMGWKKGESLSRGGSWVVRWFGFVMTNGFDRRRVPYIVLFHFL